MAAVARYSTEARDRQQPSEPRWPCLATNVLVLHDLEPAVVEAHAERGTVDLGVAERAVVPVDAGDLGTARGVLEALDLDRVDLVAVVVVDVDLAVGVRVCPK